jgi:hypothetical protein
MNPLDIADNNVEHLYFEFARRLRAVLDEVGAATHEPWMVVEGYRSQARQTWLFAQGRTRPGRKVTWIREPKWHGCGLAADVMPVHKAYAAPREWWEKLQEIGRQHGLKNPAWNAGDLGHLQLDTPEKGPVRLAALEWTRKGFPKMPDPTPTPITAPHVLIDGKPADIPMVEQGGHWYLQARAVAEAMGWPQPEWNAAVQELNVRTK